MPLEAPKLDVRKYEDLVAEARRRIPLYTPEWSDFNDSDPGMALVQLFAWLTDTMLYQMNRLPELNYIKLLQLLNLEQEPAQPAVAHLTFTAVPDAQRVSVSQGTQVTAQGDDGVPLVFETQKPLDVVRMPLAQVQVYSNGSFQIVTEQNQKAGVTFAPFGWTPEVGNALYLGFEGEIELPPQVRRFPSEVRLRVFLSPEAAQQAVLSANEIGEEARLPAPPVTLVWEYRPNAEARYWRPLNVMLDDSLAFTREGYVSFEGPEEMQATLEGKVTDVPLFWIRCRLAGGSFDAGHAPEVDLLAPNTVPAMNLATVRDEILGESDGSPKQLFSLQNLPVSDLTLEVQDTDGSFESWQRVDDFLASKATDAHYMLNPTRGEVQFGDGKRGRIPVAASQIVARSYRYGGGKAGNVGEGAIATLTTFVEGVQEVTNLRRAEGGRDEQSLEDLKLYAPRSLRNKGRAVSAEDFTALALKVGGVLNATSVPLMHPEHEGVSVPGAITVVIVPDAETRAPEPSTDLKERVAAYLNSRRLLTTELYVKGPRYLRVKIIARLSAEPYASLDETYAKVKEALKTRLSPRHRKFGEDLHPSQIYDIVLDVQGVQAVSSLRLVVNGREIEGLTSVVPVPPDGLICDSGEHEIAVVRSEDR
jgi:hypothetical protein